MNHLLAINDFRTRYEDVNRLETKSTRKKPTKVRFDHPPVNSYYPYPMYQYPSYYGGGEERKPKKDSKYKVGRIHKGTRYEGYTGTSL